jgi:hypothetical protein
MTKCKKCGGPAPKDHDICWVCEHEPKLGIHKDDEKKCSKDACDIYSDSKGIFRL